MATLLASGLTVAASAQAADQPLSLGECLPRATEPLPTCVPATTVEEHALVTLIRARAWLRARQLSEAAKELAANLGQLEGSANIGLLVQSHAAYGDALFAASQISAAETEWQAASRIWASEAALNWIRGLSPEGAHRAVRFAADAAGGAATHLAESRVRRAEVPPPAFVPGSTRDRKASFLRYLTQQLAPWLGSRHEAIRAAEQELEQVYLVPGLAPQWRAAVATDIGSLWARFVEQYIHAEDSCGSACYEPRNAYYHYDFDDSWEPYKHRARDAFEVAVAISRQHHFVTEYTLVCERWLARNYRSEYAALDELFPSPDWKRQALQAAAVRLQ